MGIELLSIACKASQAMNCKNMKKQDGYLCTMIDFFLFFLDINIKDNVYVITF